MPNPFSQLLEGYYSIGKDRNKVHDDNEEDNKEGVVSDLLPELELSMSDEELIKLKKDWEKRWEPYSVDIEKLQTKNEDYWLGHQYSKEKQPIDNLIFEALETFLPIATRPKADPTVEGSEEGKRVQTLVRQMLIHLIDVLNYNLKLKQVVRYWALYLLGVMKVGWSMKTNDITCKPIRPQKLILDPDATIEEGEYTGYYIGEYLKDQASDLVLRFPKKEKYIREQAKDKMGTTIQYIMWTTDEYVFWTLNDEVLDKKKNPHWNYDSEQTQMDEMGVETSQSVEGRNHFKVPKKPYIFLSIFNLGKQPHDETNLINQNITLQDLINKRLLQIDKNADSTNGGLIVSGDAFTEKQAQQAGAALRKGGTVYVPSGPVDQSVRRDTGTALPPFIYQSLLDCRNELRNIFGTRGSTPQGTVNEQTVRGKLIVKGQDVDRIGGGVSKYLEQFSDQVYNWFVQLMYVYYDEPHSASVLGAERAKEYITLQSNQLTSDLLVSVKEGSMIPHDPVSERNEAIDLWGVGALDPITFFDKLEFPNPRETARQLFLWKANPIALFPDLMAQQQQAEAVAGLKEEVQGKQQKVDEERRFQQEQTGKLQQIKLQGANKQQNAKK